MLSYIYKNKKKNKEKVIDICTGELGALVVRNKKNSLLMEGKDIHILIEKNYTYVLLDNETVNIQELERMF